MKLKRWLCFTAMIASELCIHAQDYSANKSIGVRFHYGHLMQHGIEVAHLAPQQMHGFEFDYKEYSRGKKNWQQRYRYPHQGISVIYFAYNPNNPIGNNLSIVPYFEKRLLGKYANYISYKIGMGPGFVKKRFDETTNDQNNMISTFLNFSLCGQLKGQVKIAGPWSVNVGAGILHLSNGAWKMPNQGVNQLSLQVGLEYALSNDTSKLRSPQNKTTSSHHAILYYSSGLKEYDIHYGQRMILQAMALYEFRMNDKSALSAGIDFMYDPSKYKYVQANKLPFQNNLRDLQLWGVVMGHELFVNHCSLITQLGIYLYNPINSREKMYQRYGLRYYLSPKLFGGVSLKAHLGAADWVEWGIGYKF